MLGVMASQRPAIATYLDSDHSATDLSTYTFTDMSIGTAYNNRYIAIFVNVPSSSAAADVTSVTIGGIAASQLIGTQLTLNNKAYLYGAIVPTGTTATVVIALDATAVRCAVSLYSIAGQKSNTPINTYADITDPPSQSVVVPAGGCLVAFSQENGATLSATWTGATEDFDINLTDSGGGITYTGAHLNSPNGFSGTLSVTWSAAYTNANLLAATFR